MLSGLKPSTSKERRLLFIETLLGITDAVSKVAPNSVLSGVAGGVSKIAGKAEKDIILGISLLYPDHASGSDLDQVALNFGISPRQGAQGSSTYVRITADPGTQYLQNTHYFLAGNGTVFELEDDFTMNAFGYDYVKVRSTSQGSDTNVDPLTISKVTPAPNGHKNVVNETIAIGGRDVESDELFRIRIKDGANIMARGTLAMLEQVFISINSKVLKIFHDGTDTDGKVVIAILTQNGSDLSPTELDNLLTGASKYFTLSEYKPFGSNFYGVRLKNVDYDPFDMSFRCSLDNNADPDEVRKSIQVGVSKYVDFRFFDATRDKVEWDNLLQIVKNTKGMKYVPDQYFVPRADISVAVNKFPRLRGFLMLDLDGNIIANFSGTLSPVYYPNKPDFSYQTTVLNR